MGNVRLFLVFLVAACAPDHEAAVVTTRAKPVTTTPKPMTCISCTNLDCFSAPREVACGAADKFCMSLVVDDNAGNRVITKGCTNTTHCTADYYRTTRVQPLCKLVDHQVTGNDLRCFFCCKGANCNAGPNLQPEASTLFTTTTG